MSQICFACDSDWGTIFLASSQPTSLLIICFSPVQLSRGLSVLLGVVGGSLAVNHC